MGAVADYLVMRQWQGNRVKLLRNAAIVLVFALVQQISPASAETAAWRKVEGPLREVTDLPAIEQLARDYPYSSNVHLALLNAYLEAGMTDSAWREIEFLASRGYVFSAAGQAALLGLYEGDFRQKLAELFASERGPLEASEPLATVPAGALLVEGAAYDARTGRLFASTIVSRDLHVRNADGGWSTVEIVGAGSLASMALDESRRTLWIATGIYDETPEPRRGVEGVFGLDLDSGETFRKAAPEGSTPSDIALAADGGLYASDPLSGAIYYAHADLWQMWPIVEPGTFRSPQGLVPWDGSLIVSDYGYGLAFVDADGKAWRIESDVPALLDGIDGMWRRGDTIVAIQNGARPPRIVELSMSADGRRVTGLRELERGHPAWTEPLGGTIVGDSLVYVGTGQWAAFGPGGALRDGARTSPTELRILQLGETPAPPP